MSFLEKNLAAMRPHTPEAAAFIGAAAVPDGFVPAIGTDGAATFLRKMPDHLEWLGETSMPAASAAPLVAGLNPGTANGLALSIGTGHEWMAFLSRLPRTQALYVYEPDAALCRMALAVCDLSAHLASARLVLLVGTKEEAAGELERFLASHLGHEPPAVLHPLPTLTGDRRNLLLSSGEAVVRHAIQARQSTVTRLAGEMGNLSGESEVPLALLATPRYPTERPLHDSLAPDAPRLYLDQHGSTSIALRAQTLLTHRPRRVVSDFFRPDLASVPPGIAVETWIPPLVGPVFWQPGNRIPNPSALQPHDGVVVHAHVHRVLLESMGFPAQQIELRPLQVTAASGAAVISSGVRVALIADLPRTDATSLGVQLPTHQAVHAAASALIIDDYLTVNFNSAADILRRALAKAGVPASAAESDPGLQEPMLRIIRDILIPALPLLTLARHLIDQQIPVQLIGDWPNLDQPASPLCTATPFSQANLWDDVCAVVHLSPWGNVAPLLLHAHAAGIPVVAPRHPADGFPASLPTLLPESEEFLRPVTAQLLPVLKSLLRRKK